MLNHTLIRTRPTWAPSFPTLDQINAAAELITTKWDEVVDAASIEMHARLRLVANLR